MRETPLEASMQYVRGIIWPARKAELLRAMEQNGAPGDVLEAVRVYRLERFVAPSDVHMALRPRS